MTAKAISSISLLLKELHRISLMVLLFSCGTFVGNPTLPDGDKDKQTSSADFNLPDLTFDFPATLTDDTTLQLTKLSEEDLVRRNNGENISILKRWLNRVTGILKRSNKILKRLKHQDQIKTFGKFKDKGPFNDISGAISELDNDPNYHYQAIICHENQIFFHVKWHKDQSQIMLMHNFNREPLKDDDAADFFTKILFSKDSSANNISIRYFGQGKPFKKPPEVSDGDLLVEAIQFDRDDQDETKIKGVNDWYATLPQNGNFSGDTYLAGKVTKQGSGLYVAYQKFNELVCDGINFDETNLDQPGWCIGRLAGKQKRFSKDQIMSAWEELKPIGIAKKADLQVLAFDSALSCPE